MTESNFEIIKLKLANTVRADDFDEPKEGEIPADVHDDLTYLIEEVERLRAILPDPELVKDIWERAKGHYGPGAHKTEIATWAMNLSDFYKSWVP